MKFCPKCGTQLDDDARFCPKCGAPQPGTEVETRPEVNPNPTPVNTTLTPSQEFDELEKNDPKFRAIRKAAKKCGLFILINGAFLVPFFVNMFAPVAAFTGNNIPAGGGEMLIGMGVTSFPHEFGALPSYFYCIAAGNYKMTPDNAIDNPMALLLFIFGFIFFGLLFLMAFAGYPRGYLLKTYKKQGGDQELIKTLKHNTHFIYGAAISVITCIPAIGTFINANNIDYSGGGHYIFGELTSVAGGLVAAIIVTVIFAAGMIVAGILLRKLATKELDQYITK